MRAVILITLILVTVIALRGCGEDDAEAERQGYKPYVPRNEVE